MSNASSERSSGRVLTTHTGSLPRPADLLALIRQPRDPDAFEARVRTAVGEIVLRQHEVGIDVVNDGEQGRRDYTSYITDRLTGFDGEPEPMLSGGAKDMKDFPEFAATLGAGSPIQPTCSGPIAWKDFNGVEKDIANLRSAAAASEGSDVFMTSVSPGQAARFLANRYYPSHEEYVLALADVLKREYAAIVEAGFVLQIDCPDLASGRNNQFQDLSLDEFRRVAAMHVDAINHATAGLPPERMRLHVCWGNYEGPHHHDVPLRDIIDLLFAARPAGLVVEGANPRHAHEWAIFEDLELPAGKVLIPGVIDTTTNFIEHPELVAQRIVQYARVVGKDNIIAGADCGFATFADAPQVDPKIAWAKLGSLVEGARLASRTLYSA